MNGLNLIFLFFIFLLSIVFLIGAIILLLGLLKKNKRNSISKIGLIFIGIPIGIFAIIFIYDFSHDIFTKKPVDKDLVGIYHITDAGRLIPTNQYRLYTIEFKKDGTFYLSPTPNINVCESGKYSVDWEFDFNELSFQCDKGFTTAHIDRGFAGFRIEFIISDPDSGDSIFFTKDK